MSTNIYKLSIFRIFFTINCYSRSYLIHIAMFNTCKSV
nr:MAG TPA: hypothetical protein [Caudoviricetes sp.]